MACGVRVKESGEKMAHGKKACIRKSLYEDEHLLTGESSNHSNFCSVNSDYNLKIKTTMRFSRRFDVKKLIRIKVFFRFYLGFNLSFSTTNVRFSVCISIKVFRYRWFLFCSFSKICDFIEVL